MPDVAEATNGTSIGLPVITEQETRVLLQTGTKEEGTTTVPILKEVKEKEAEDLIKAGATEIGRQTFLINKAQSDVGMAELAPDEEERVNNFNRGAKVKQQNKAHQLLVETDDDGQPVFEFSSEAYDLRSFINEPTAKRGLSETEKGLRSVKKLPAQVQYQVLIGMGVPEETARQVAGL